MNYQNNYSFLNAKKPQSFSLDKKRGIVKKRRVNTKLQAIFSFLSDNSLRMKQNKMSFTQQRLETKEYTFFNNALTIRSRCQVSLCLHTQAINQSHISGIGKQEIKKKKNKNALYSNKTSLNLIRKIITSKNLNIFGTINISKKFKSEKDLSDAKKFFGVGSQAKVYLKKSKPINKIFSDTSNNFTIQQKPSIVNFKILEKQSNSELTQNNAIDQSKRTSKQQAFPVTFVPFHKTKMFFNKIYDFNMKIKPQTCCDFSALKKNDTSLDYSNKAGKPNAVLSPKNSLSWALRVNSDFILLKQKRVNSEKWTKPLGNKKRHADLGSYSKMMEINLITISLASANRIRQWAEKTLPSGKVVGEVINPETVHYKTLKPIKGGLFCERIFGPLKDHECACGKKFNIKNYLAKVTENQQVSLQKRYFCRNCDVEYTYSIIRRTQLGFIQLASPTTHVWFVKGIPSYISILLDMKKKHLQNVIYNTETLTLEHGCRVRRFLPSSPSSIFESWQKIMKIQYPEKYGQETNSISKSTKIKNTNKKSLANLKITPENSKTSNSELTLFCFSKMNAALAFSFPDGRKNQKLLYKENKKKYFSTKFPNTFQKGSYNFSMETDKLYGQIKKITDQDYKMWRTQISPALHISNDQFYMNIKKKPLFVLLSDKKTIIDDQNKLKKQQYFIACKVGKIKSYSIPYRTLKIKKDKANPRKNAVYFGQHRWFRVASKILKQNKKPSNTKNLSLLTNIFISTPNNTLSLIQMISSAELKHSSIRYAINNLKQFSTSALAQQNFKQPISCITPRVILNSFILKYSLLKVLKFFSKINQKTMCFLTTNKNNTEAMFFSSCSLPIDLKLQQKSPAVNQDSSNPKPIYRTLIALWKINNMENSITKFFVNTLVGFTYKTSSKIQASEARHTPSGDPKFRFYQQIVFAEGKAALASFILTKSLKSYNLNFFEKRTTKLAIMLFLNLTNKKNQKNLTKIGAFKKIKNKLKIKLVQRLQACYIFNQGLEIYNTIFQLFSISQKKINKAISKGTAVSFENYDNKKTAFPKQASQDSKKYSKAMEPWQSQNNLKIAYSEFSELTRKTRNQLSGSCHHKYGQILIQGLNLGCKESMQLIETVQLTLRHFLAKANNNLSSELTLFCFSKMNVDENSSSQLWKQQQEPIIILQPAFSFLKIEISLPNKIKQKQFNHTVIGTANQAFHVIKYFNTLKGLKLLTQYFFFLKQSKQILVYKLYNTLKADFERTKNQYLKKMLVLKTFFSYKFKSSILLKKQLNFEKHTQITNMLKGDWLHQTTNYLSSTNGFTEPTNSIYNDNKASTAFILLKQKRVNSEYKESELTWNTKTTPMPHHSNSALALPKNLIVNNIYCLSHRELWEQDKDWQDFAYYYYTSISFNRTDIPIPVYKHRNYDILFSMDNTFSYPSSNYFTMKTQYYSLGMNINTAFSGAGLIQKLLNEFNYSELKKMDKQNRIILFEYNKQIQKLKKKMNSDQYSQTGTRKSKSKQVYYKACHSRDLLIRRTKLTRKIFSTGKTPSNTENNYQVSAISDLETNGLNMILTLLPVLPPVLRPVLKMAGQFTISDLNRLYQRIIYRNERLKKFLKDPALSSSFEMKYAQRLLQEAVDNLIQNGKSGVVPEKDSRGRLLKSLSDILKGKQGRFRQYLLGKRVDYSGRSVIVVGPRLKIHECGIPKEMALVLYSPFLIKRLLNEKIVDTYLSAKKIIKTNPLLVSQLLREIMKSCPVLLNRAPTLHRLGFQAFQPKLVDGKAILLHPLVCPAFNADFDGDQMAVHVPITFEARAEAWKLMLARNNLLSPATGDPLILPSQDMVLGCYYLTTNCAEKLSKFKKGSGMYFHNINEVFKAYNQQLIHIHAVIWVSLKGQVENGNTVEQPLEIRIPLAQFKLNKNQQIKYQKDSQAEKQIQRMFSLENNRYIEIYSKSHNFLNLKGKVTNQIIRTTPGKILFNIIIKNAIEKRPSLLAKYKKAGLIKKQLITAFDLETTNFFRR
uniref:DNA-directed RNA polymerase subunit n=1 Tax=Colemanosphaera angeleri TaxID=1454018 RepID=A0A6C0RW22_9CHLO|nr:beta' subunit of RNA polymerase [Colemanosphaera angeleri]QIA47167.1 beta' subunit of RNA polymerase [Colemanosphaera angeleri]